MTVLLSGQVQELNAQEVRVEVLLRPNGLVQVPFHAIYSPRGNPVQLFSVRVGQAVIHDAQLIAMASPTTVWVAADLDVREPVIVQGLNDLLPGDPVEEAAAQQDFP